MKAGFVSNKLLAADSKLSQRLWELHVAGRVFGQAVAIPREDKDYASIEALNAAMQKERNGRPWEPGKSAPSEKRPPEDATVETSAPTPEGVRIRDRVLDFLKNVGTKGSQASTIRKYLEEVYGVKTHEKTVGMTLYRLSQDKLVRRQGRTWFFGPPSAESKNPGSSAPGSLEARSNGKEVET